MTDDLSVLTDTDRAMGRRRIAAGEARTALIRRRYAAPIDDVWDACTNPARLSRFFIKPTGDLREGGTFHLEGNASGEILSCEPPRLLRVTWAYGDRAVDEVELRLFPGEHGDTVLELEHATVTGRVEWDGEMVAVIPGVGVGWELSLNYLAKYLRGDLPDAPPTEWYDEDNPEDQAFATRCGQAWAVVVEGVDAERHAATLSDRGKP